jgi:hypothetical protein
MCDRQVVWLQNSVRYPGPAVTLQRAQETHPAMKECLVSGLDKSVPVLCTGVQNLHRQNELGTV